MFNTSHHVIHISTGLIVRSRPLRFLPLLLILFLTTFCTLAGAVDIITTVAGNGTKGYSGDGGDATGAQLDYPSGVAIDNNGTLYIADSGNYRVRKVDTSGLLTTVAGNGSFGHSGDGGEATNASLVGPANVTIDNHGNLYIADSFNIASTFNIDLGIWDLVLGQIRKVDSMGVITTVTIGSFPFIPISITIDNHGNLYIADSAANPFVSHRICKVDTTNICTTVAGINNGADNWGYSGDGGIATKARLNYPNGVAIDNSGNLYIADTDNHRIRKVDTTGIITTVAGNGTMGYNGDGEAATHARLARPTSVAIDNIGNLYIADTGNHRIRKVYPAGIITTVAGNGTAGYSGDGGEATNAQLNNPAGVTLDSYGNLYIADRNNHRIRKVSPVPLPPVEPTLLETGQVNNTFNAAGQTFPTEVTIHEGGRVFYATFENTVYNQGIISNSTLRGETDNHGSISNVTCEGEVKNNGFMSNLTLSPSATLTGGILSGTITNQGTITDIQFLGIVLEGGTLAGTLTNASRIGGTIKNVHFAAHAKLSGGTLTGNLQGDCQAPAQLDHLTVTAGSHLSCITIGPQVTLEKGVTVESPPPTDLPSLGNGIATNDQGETVTTTAKFTGGVSINGRQPFEPTATAKGFIDNLNIQGNITMDTPTTDIVVFLTYQATATDQPVWLMMDGKGGYWPWNQQPASLVPFRRDITLTPAQPIVLYQGVWLMTGILKITFGYRLRDGTLIQSPKAIEIELTQ